MTLPLLGVDDPNAQFNFDRIALALLDTGGRAVRLRFGRATISFSADWNSAGLTVTHGMDSTPVTVVATAEAYTSTTANINVAVSSIGATTFVLSGREIDKTAITQNVFVYWLAFG